MKPTAILPVKRFGEAKSRLAAGIDDDAEPPFDQRQVLSVGADER